MNLMGLMKQSLAFILCVCLLPIASAHPSHNGQQANTAPQPYQDYQPSNTDSSYLGTLRENVVVIETNMGDMVVQLNAELAPRTVGNFKYYVDQSFYDGLVFHRVINNFMIQAGGFDNDLYRQKANRTVENESIGGLSNVRGSISMARTSNPHSASSQFFINHKDNQFLDGQPNRPGYTVFGQVLEGLDVLDAIAQVKTMRKMNMNDVPVDHVIIHTIRYRSLHEQLRTTLLSIKK